MTTQNLSRMLLVAIAALRKFQGIISLLLLELWVTATASITKVVRVRYLNDFGEC